MSTSGKDGEERLPAKHLDEIDVGLQIAKQNALKNLVSLRKNWQQEIHTPARLRINGKNTYDRAEWLNGVLESGKNRFSDPGNIMNHQMHRLSQARLITYNDKLDGVRRQHIELWDTLQPRAALRSGSAGCAHGNSYLELPFLAVARVHAHFEQLACCGQGADTPVYRAS